MWKISGRSGATGPPGGLPIRDTSTVGDWSDDRRKARLRETRLGHSCNRLQRFLLWAALILVAFVVAYSQYWVHDVAPERIRLAHTHPELHQIYEAARPSARETMVVELAGLGRSDSTRTAAALSAYALVGSVWALRYDDAGLDTKVIAELITERAEAIGIDRIVLSGHSMGGVVAVEVARHLYRDTGLTLLGVILDCTPIDLHAVRPTVRGIGEDMLRWMGWVPGARESRTLRTIVEMAARSDRFLAWNPRGYPRVDPDAFIDVADEVLTDKILSYTAATNGLIESQFTIIVAAGAVRNLSALGDERDDKPRPAIVFVRPRDALRDPIVDVAYTQRSLVRCCGGPDGTLLVVRLRGIGHADPARHPDLYNQAITAQMIPFLEQSR